MPRIVIFGPTGFTGDLTVRALVDDGQEPLLVGRNPAKLQAMADQFGGLDHATADAQRPDELQELVESGDVLVSLSGPFVKVGYAALEAATTQGAHYVDSTGEPPFIRDVFEQYGPRAKAKNVALLTAMGYDYVPGNLAALHALEDAGPEGTRVQVGYFVKGPVSPKGLSGGTQASLMGAVLDKSFRREAGVLEIERAGIHFQRFEIQGKQRDGVSVGASEHFTLPKEFPQVESVETYLGWFGPASRVVSAWSRTGGALFSKPPLKQGITALTSRLFPGSTGGPGEELRAKHRTLAVADVFDAKGAKLARAVVQGVSPYDFTGRMLAWSARRLLETGSEQSGALGPATAFGRQAFVEGARTAGIQRVE